MAHHGDDPNAKFAEIPEFLRSLPERKLDEQFDYRKLQQAREVDPNSTQQPFGATGRFPQGKLNDDDEGEIQFGVSHTIDKVLIKFGKPVAWMGMDPDQAMQLAELLTRHAASIREGT